MIALRRMKTEIGAPTLKNGGFLRIETAHGRKRLPLNRPNFDTTRTRSGCATQLPDGVSGARAILNINHRGQGVAEPMPFPQPTEHTLMSGCVLVAVTYWN